MSVATPLIPGTLTLNWVGNCFANTVLPASAPPPVPLLLLLPLLEPPVPPVPLVALLPPPIPPVDPLGLPVVAELSLNWSSPSRTPQPPASAVRPRRGSVRSTRLVVISRPLAGLALSWKLPRAAAEAAETYAAVSGP